MDLVRLFAFALALSACATPTVAKPDAAPASDASSTGRRPKRSLNAPSTGENRNCIAA